MAGRLLILGYGYTAFFLSQKVRVGRPDWWVHTTSRRGGDHILFDLNQPNTWDNLPQADYTVWSFPAEPLSIVQKFFETKAKTLGKLVVIGSTSAFKTLKEDEEVNEGTRLDMSIARVEGEEYLRSLGAISLLSAGIYGPGREPIDWVKKGYVGRSPKFVNLVHVDDLCTFILGALDCGRPGHLYIASNNKPVRWQDIIDHWEQQGLIKGTLEKPSARVSKKVNCSQSIQELGIRLRHSLLAPIAGDP